MGDIIKFDYGHLRYYLLCEGNQENEVKMKVKDLNRNFISLMAYIQNEKIQCRVEALSPDAMYVERAERYNKLYMDCGMYLCN